jgi:hypothetical protein
VSETQLPPPMAVTLVGVITIAEGRATPPERVAQIAECQALDVRRIPRLRRKAPLVRRVQL